MSLLIRPPGDAFTFRLFFNLANKIPDPKSLLYIWSPILDPTYRERKITEAGYHDKDGTWFDEHHYWVPEHEFVYRQMIIDNLNSDTIVLGVKDHLTPYQFNPWTESQPTMARYLEGLFEYYENKKFILFTSMENLKPYISATNVSIVPWGGDITNQQSEYKKLEPLTNKNLNSKYNYLSLNRNPRSHRAMSASLLHGLGIQDHGLISCMFTDKIDDIFEYTGWQFTDSQNEIKSTIDTGFKLLKNNKCLLTDKWEIYTETSNDNVSNFKNKLSNYYADTFVEIIAETSYTEVAYNLTEKTLNSIYGYNFPIVLCSAGSVEFLRSMGMDVFDDIIDHSYDKIENPIDRLYCAISNNLEILTNNNRVKELWAKNQHRFANNVDFAKNKLYNFYATRAENLFLKVKNDFNL
jgi:hypothetical protein